MKKTNRFLMAMVLSAGFILQVQAMEPMSAVVIRPAGDCTIADGNALDDLMSGNPINWVSSTDTRFVATRSKNGNAKFICKLTDVPNDTGRTVHFGPDVALQYLGIEFPCALFEAGRLYYTLDWRQVVSPSGEAKLICEFKD